MSIGISPSMGKILALTKAGRLNEATQAIRNSLSGADTVPDGETHAPMREARRVTQSLPSPKVEPERPAPGSTPSPDRPTPETAGRTIRARYKSSRGGLDYALYVPTGYEGPLPLVVMLHGCTQSAADFERGTRMTDLAQEMGFVVAYPEQSASANQQKCWNWFREGDQRRDAGEPALIAGLTRAIIGDYAIDPERVYVAGLSAGGAAAAIMAATYPDIFAAAGIHSGLACGSARDLPSAFAAMKGKARKRTARTASYVPLITFHGDQDKTVHPDNSAQIHAGFAAAPQLKGLKREVEESASPSGRRYRRTSLTDPAGRSYSEDWQIAGAGHAWSGGSADGSYTEPGGPDASREMMRFFLQHRRQG